VKPFKNCMLNVHGFIGYLDSFALSFVSAAPPPKPSRADASVVVFLIQSSLNKRKIMYHDCEDLCCVPWAVSERPSWFVRILVSAWRDCPKKIRKIEWWKTVRQWWLSTDQSGVQGLYYDFNHQDKFVMNSLGTRIFGRLWDYANKIGNLLKA
jgi:hypothetical protein